MPPFAVPLALGNLSGDADIARHADEGANGKVPACKERGRAILNVCELYEGAPLVLALFVDGGSCPAVLGDMQAISSSFPGVRFAAVAVKNGRSQVRATDPQARADDARRPGQRRRAGGAVQARHLPAGHLRLSRRRGAEPRSAHATAARDAAPARRRTRRWLARAGMEAAEQEAAGGEPARAGGADAQTTTTRTSR